MSEDQANLHKLLSNGYTSCDERGLKGRSRRSVGPRKLDSESFMLQCRFCGLKCENVVLCCSLIKFYSIDVFTVIHCKSIFLISFFNEFQV